MPRRETESTLRDGWVRSLPWMICFALFLTVVLVALPAVGHATFLADQVDQIVSFWALFQGWAVAFYGPVMSGTTPPVHALGPVPAIVLGLPIAFGLNPDQLHLLLIAWLACGVVTAYWGLAQVDFDSALLWCAVILASPALWWASSMLWSSIMPVWFSLAALGLLAGYTRSANLLSAALFLACWFAGLCSHLTSVVTLPLLVCFLWLAYKDKRLQRSRGARVLTAFAAPFVLFIPYCLGEARTGFADTTAILANLTRNVGSINHATGLNSAFESLAIALDPLRLQWRFDWRCPHYLLILWFLGITVLAFLSLRRFGKDTDLGHSGNLWRAILAVYVSGVLLQMVFFWAMNRPLLGWHYTLALLPIYPAPYVIVGRLVLVRLRPRVRLTVVGFFSIGLVTVGAVKADRFFELDSWNFRQTTAALSSICTQCSSVNTIEDDGPFIPQSGPYEPVLNFLIKKYVPTCHPSDNPDFVLVPRRNGIMSSTVVHFGGREYHWLRTVPPGIGVYGGAREQSALPVVDQPSDHP